LTWRSDEAAMSCWRWVEQRSLVWSRINSCDVLSELHHGLADQQIPSSLVVSCVIWLAGDFPRKTPSRAVNLKEIWRHSYSKWRHLSFRGDDWNMLWICQSATPCLCYPPIWGRVILWVYTG
jgi:hypothetical protein